MTFLDDRLDGRSQHFTFARRELLQKIASAALLFSAPRSGLVFEVPKKYPAPQFRISDSVASDWVDEFGEDVTDFGEILGVRWLPKGHSSFRANTWVYYIYWTHSTCGASSCYPCHDGEPTEESQLRFVNHD